MCSGRQCLLRAASGRPSAGVTEPNARLHLANCTRQGAHALITVRWVLACAVKDLVQNSFYQWVSQRRELRDRLVLHENVPRFGVDELREQLGDLYYIERSLVSPKELGWASARPRQITVLILKQWLDEILASTGVPPQVGVHASNRPMSGPMSGQDVVKRFVHFVRALFSRACNITLDAYLNEA